MKDLTKLLQERERDVTVSFDSRDVIVAFPEPPDEEVRKWLRKRGFYYFSRRWWKTPREAYWTISIGVKVIRGQLELSDAELMWVELRSLRAIGREAAKVADGLEKKGLHVLVVCQRCGEEIRDKDELPHHVASCYVVF